ncbi:hypothetical protein OPT61_g5118 [Boeremia exigua]|uniref:Uncharacterized protein n=1 Tax=Boeremia exigua TaxID=749465 RepID=A0ACC2IBL6_9PLEO|nr:hypothetical protein OPT61_g5118 [Boeremia exigua]
MDYSTYLATIRTSIGVPPDESRNDGRFVDDDLNADKTFKDVGTLYILEHVANLSIHACRDTSICTPYGWLSVYQLQCAPTEGHNGKNLASLRSPALLIHFTGRTIIKDSARVFFPSKLATAGSQGDGHARLDRGRWRSDQVVKRSYGHAAAEGHASEARKDRAVGTKVGANKLITGLREGCLKRHYTANVATNSTRSNIIAVLESAGLHGMIDDEGCSSDTKPACGTTPALIFGASPAFLLALTAAATREEGTVQMDLSFPRNATYATSSYFPIVFAQTNSTPAIYLRDRLNILIFPYPHTEEDWIDPPRLITYHFDMQHLTYPSDAPLFITRGFNITDDGVWLLRWRWSWDTCSTNSDTPPGDPAGSARSVAGNLVFTTRASAPTLDLVAATRDASCSDDSWVVLNVTDTLDVERKYWDPIGRCPVVADSGPAMNRCPALIDSAAASKVSDALASQRCEAASPADDCRPDDHEGAAGRIVVGTARFDAVCASHMGSNVRFESGVPSTPRRYMQRQHVIKASNVLAIVLVSRTL